MSKDIDIHELSELLKNKKTASFVQTVKEKQNDEKIKKENILVYSDIELTDEQIASNRALYPHISITDFKGSF